MKYGTLVFPAPGLVGDARIAEDHGFSQAWIPDSQMIYGDVYASLALAAERTETIRLGTGIAVSGHRTPPVTAHSIATINQMAPGRVTLGFGTGHTSRLVMGMKPTSVDVFREELRVIRDLLESGESWYDDGREARKIRFVHQTHGFIKLKPRVPIYVAATGKRALEIAGQLGDGLITTGGANVSQLRERLSTVKSAAEGAGRSTEGFEFVVLTHVCVLKPGETLKSSRVVAAVGHWAMSILHTYWQRGVQPEQLAAGVGESYKRFLDHAKRMRTPDRERYLEIHEGHCLYLKPDQARFVTPDVIRATTIVGSRNEVRERIVELEEAGITQLIVNPPLGGMKDFAKSFSADVIAQG